MDDNRYGSAVQIDLPVPQAAAHVRIGRRVVLALALIVFVALVAWFGGGHTDPEDKEVSLLDAFYYATVSITTTGYGDIRPVTDEARLLTTLLITPARIVFLILLVGTTLEVLTKSTRDAYREARWRRQLKEHIVICGFGTKGRSAGRALVDRGVPPERVVVIEKSEEARRQATSFGFAAVAGDAARADVLRAADVHEAESVIVAAQRDDAAVLITLTARELNADARIVAAVREEENAHLLRQSGADTVITSSGAAGRLLGVATHTPRVADVFEDLLMVGEGLDILQRRVEERECGPNGSMNPQDHVVAIIRDGELLKFDDERAATLMPGDDLVYLRSNND